MGFEVEHVVGRQTGVAGNDNQIDLRSILSVVTPYQPNSL
ncbi:hypothetical protein N825_24795 [Skermanella stibiiresistens SB22]|uniref:Uncharacterized protein n=1 Tax=Skermanella stibiiresistens SB22 TaxID=1385369 RepID=W9HAT9_9PROT|nr:hypothetical protein N825_24795 [Skermanella stibiiresistens SB22]